MEESIGKLCSTVAKFCNHLQSSCSALKESVDRRPIPLDSASTTFVHSINRRLTAASGDLDLLESMSLATVSFEELLGHCNEVLKKNQTDFFDLEEHLRFSSNYIPPLDFDEEDVMDDYASNNFSPGSNIGQKSDLAYEDPSYPFNLVDDSMSLKNFGISDVCLATIASQADCKYDMNEPEFEIKGEITDEFDQYEDSTLLLNVTQDDYESLPKHMKGLVSWEDLQVAVGKMNSYIQKKINPNTIDQAEIESLGLGYKARSYLLLLIKMNRLCVETDEGIISYRLQQ